MAAISTPFIRWANHSMYGKITLGGQALLWSAAEKVCYAHFSFKGVVMILVAMCIPQSKSNMKDIGFIFISQTL